MTHAISWTLGSGVRRLRPGRALPILMGSLLLCGAGVPASATPHDVSGDAEGVSASSAEHEAAAEVDPYALTGRSGSEMRLGFADLSVHDDPWTETVDVTGGAFSVVLSTTSPSPPVPSRIENGRPLYPSTAGWCASSLRARSSAGSLPGRGRPEEDPGLPGTEWRRRSS
jgi:hypothetical protein